MLRSSIAFAAGCATICSIGVSAVSCAVMGGVRSRPMTMALQVDLQRYACLGRGNLPLAVFGQQRPVALQYRNPATGG